MEQRLVAVLERGEPDVPLEVVRLAPDVLELQGDLVLDVDDARRQQAAQPEGVALLLGERRVLVEHRVREQRHAAQGDGRRAGAGPQRVEDGARQAVGVAARRGRVGESHGDPPGRGDDAGRDGTVAGRPGAVLSAGDDDGGMGVRRDVLGHAALERPGEAPSPRVPMTIVS